MKIIIAFINAYTQGISGGDKIFIDSFKNKKNILIVTSLLGKKLCLDYKINAKYIITSKESHFNNPMVTYFYRTFTAIINTIRLNPTAIHSSSDFIPDVLPSYILKILHPTSPWTQMIFHLIPKERKITYLFQKLSFIFIKSKANRIFVDNTILKEDLISKLDFPKQKILLLKINTDKKLINSIKPSSKKFNAIFIGQLRESKGIFDLIKIWKKIIKFNPNYKLAIIGQDVNNNRQKLLILINTNNLSKNISILGYLPDSEKFSIIKSSDFVVIPSYEEGYGLAVRECLACLKPVLIYNLPVFSKLKNKNLYKFSLGNYHQISQFIIKEYIENE